MRKDLVKTVAGLIVVGLVVVATFLYGNHQNQQQMQHDLVLEQQQQHLAAVKRAATATKPAAAPAAATPQPKPTAIPQTGSGLWSIVTATLLIVTLRWYKMSRRTLQSARLRPGLSLYNRPPQA